jgi:hypothetical protein
LYTGGIFSTYSKNIYINGYPEVHRGKNRHTEGIQGDILNQKAHFQGKTPGTDIKVRKKYK